MELNLIWPGLAVGLAWIWVAIGQGILVRKALEVMGKAPKMSTFFLTVTILGIALVESAVIYWLVVAFSILGTEGLWLMSSIGAGLAIWLTGLGAGWGEWLLIAWALSAMARNPKIKAKIMTYMVLFVALVEVTAIYGLLVAFKIIGEGVENPAHLGAWLAIGLAWVWVAIGRWYLSEESLIVMWKNPGTLNQTLTVSILWTALVESAAIYALIISFKILGWDAEVDYSTAASLSAGLAIGLAGLGVGLWEGLLIKWAIAAMNKSPEMRGKLMAYMVLFVALVEVVAIYGFIITFQVL